MIKFYGFYFSEAQKTHPTDPVGPSLHGLWWIVEHFRNQATLGPTCFFKDLKSHSHGFGLPAWGKYHAFSCTYHKFFWLNLLSCWINYVKSHLFAGWLRISVEESQFMFFYIIFPFLMIKSHLFVTLSCPFFGGYSSNLGLRHLILRCLQVLRSLDQHPRFLQVNPSVFLPNTSNVSQMFDTVKSRSPNIFQAFQRVKPC